MFFEETFYPGLSDFDESGRLSLRSVFEAFENAGGRHSDAANDSMLNCGDRGAVWLIYDWRVKLFDRPRASFPLSVKTWTGGSVPSPSVFRDFTLKTQTGERVAEGEAMLCLYDTKENRLSRVTEDIMRPYLPEQERVFKDAPSKVRPLSYYDLEKPYFVRRADLDFNGHVHNAAYVDIIFEALPEKTVFSEVRISYLRPIKYGESVKIKTALKDGVSYICLCGEKEIFSLMEIK